MARPQLVVAVRPDRDPLHFLSSIGFRSPAVFPAAYETKFPLFESISLSLKTRYLVRSSYKVPGYVSTRYTIFTNQGCVYLLIWRVRHRV